MISEAVSDVDVRIVRARWLWLHAVWGEDPDEVEVARAAIDVLLERRYEITRASAPVA
ncbi:MAG: hypothetical protein ABI775_09595 [Pseudonocardiales bacterium]